MDIGANPIPDSPPVEKTAVVQESIWTMSPRLTRICGTVAYVAIALFACQLAPIAFTVGMLGAATTLTATPSVALWIKAHPEWISKYLSSMLDEVLGTAAMLTATACGSAIAVSVTGAAVLPSCLAAAAGYYIPLNLLHHLQVWKYPAPSDAS